MREDTWSRAIAGEVSYPDVLSMDVTRNPEIDRALRVVAEFQSGEGYAVRGPDAQGFQLAELTSTTGDIGAMVVLDDTDRATSMQSEATLLRRVLTLSHPRRKAALAFPS